MEQLINYFIEETNKKTESIGKEISEIKEALQDLKSFKIEMVVSARWVSLIVSTACGILTMAVSVFFSWKFKN